MVVETDTVRRRGSLSPSQYLALRIPCLLLRVSLPLSLHSAKTYECDYSAGLVASAASHAYSVRVLLPRLVKATATGAIARPILPSLGASGAIYGCLSITALAFPTVSPYVQRALMPSSPEGWRLL